MSYGRLPIGTRIRFLKSLYGEANEYQPDHVFAERGQLGTVVGHDCKEGHKVKADNWHAWFGASHGTEFIQVKGV